MRSTEIREPLNTACISVEMDGRYSRKTLTFFPLVKNRKFHFAKWSGNTLSHMNDLLRKYHLNSHTLECFLQAQKKPPAC